MLKEVSDDDKESPTYGQTSLVPFFHPATENPQGIEDYLKQHTFVFLFHLDPYDKVREEAALREKSEVEHD